MDYILKTPQIGEVGHEVQIVRFHKKVGEYVKKDEIIVTLETSKAALDIESSVSGTVKSILQSEGRTVVTGTDLIILQRDLDNVDVMPNVSVGLSREVNPEFIVADDSSALYAWLKQIRNREMSPRLKAYCRNEKVVPISLHRSFKGHGTGIRSEDKANQFYEDVILSKQQERLLNNLVESQERVIQANVQCMCDNACIDQYRQRLRNSKQKNVVPSRLEIISWSVVDAMRKHPNFRSRLILPNTLRQFKNTNLGIAVALQNDELRTAIVPDVLSCDFMQFVQQVRRSIGDAKEDNHVTTYHSLVISDLSTQGIVNAIPIVSHPSCATLFVGCPVQYDKKSFYLSLSFDHRFINGAGAAAFLMDVQHNIKIVTH